MLYDYLTELIGPAPTYLYGIIYILLFFAVMFGLWCVIHLISTIFRKFF